MDGAFLITGNKYNRVIKLILVLIGVVTVGLVLLAVTEFGKVTTKRKEAVVVPVSEITTEILSRSFLGNQPYLVLERTSGEYAFVKLKNANIEDEKLLGLSELVYQNGEAKLTPEINGTINIFDGNNRVVENAKVVLHGVLGITLTDGSILPVRIVNGRTSGGKLSGEVELRSLSDNSVILGTLDTRGNFENIRIVPSLQSVDAATAAVGKEVNKWLEQEQYALNIVLPGTEVAPTPSGISGAVTIDPVTGLAIINSGVVGDTQIVNGSITALKLGDSAVLTGKIADAAVTAAKITDGTITTVKLGDGAVTDAKLSQITATNKVAGSAVELKSGGGLAHGSGLTLREDCSTDQSLQWDGDSWECRTVIGGSAGVSSMNSLVGALSIAGGGINTISAIGSTITVTGALPNIGTAGTYGSTTSIPVLTTDANGRVSGVTDTAISGLTSSALAVSAGITNAQLANSNFYVSPGSGVSVSGSPVSLGGTVTIGMTDASTTVKGAASFNSTNFSVVSGAVNTVQNIDTTAEPYFHALTLSHTANQLVLGTTNTTTISSTAPSANRVATIPALTASDEFVFKNQNQTLTSKTLDAGSNTITGLTNSNLSGTAAISDSNLAQLTTTNKVAGSAVQLNASGGLTNNTGLSLITTCASGELLKWNGSAWGCAADVSGGSPALNTVTAALGANTIANGDNAQTWNWALSTAAKTAMSLGETSASTNGAGSQYILGISTLAGSTAAPFSVSARGGAIIDTTSTGALTFGNTSANTPVTINSGTGTISIGADTAAKTITIGNSTDDTFSLNSSAFKVTSAGALSGITTINASGQITSTLATGTAPFSVASTTNVANLNASSLNGATFAAPGAIGGGTASTGNFTTLTGQSIYATNTTNQLVLGTTNTTTISSTAPSANRTATIPALTASDEFVFLNQSQILTNKTIAAGSNTISGLTNSNLSGTAGITDANLAQITTANKVAGSSVQLNANGGMTNSTGLSLLTTCSSGEVLKWNGSVWACASDATGGTPSVYADGGLLSDGTGLSLLRTCSDNQILKWTAAGGWACAADNAGSGTSALSSITAATGTNTIANGDNAQAWNWALTTAAKTAFTFGETSAATNGAGSQYVLGISTLASSTAGPLKVAARGNTIIDTTSTGGITFGNTTANTPVTINSGTGTISIGADTAAKTITIGNSTDDTLSINSSAFAVTSAGALSGITTIGMSGAISGATATNTINGMIINGSTQTFSANNIADSGALTIKSATGANNLTLDSGSTGSVLIGTGVAAKTITIGNASDDTFSLNSSGLNVSSGGALTGVTSIDTIGVNSTSLSFAGAGSITSNTTNSLTLDSGSTGSVLIGTGVAAKTITIGNAADDTFSLNSSGLNVSSGGALTGVASVDTIGVSATGITFAGAGSVTTTGDTNLTLDSGTTGSVLIGTGVAAKTITIGNSNDDSLSINSSAFTVSSAGAVSGVTSLTAQSGNFTNTTNQLVLGTTNTTTISSTAPSANRTATIPALTASDEFVFLNQSGTLTNKTIAAGSNTISGLTNSNLSGTAGITDANLATITTASKVSGSAVQLNVNGGISNSTGLTLLTTCNSGEILKWNGSAWACATDSSGGSPTLNTIAAAVGANTIANGDNAQTWNWALTTAAKTAFTFGETTASTNGAGSQYILNARTLSSSTAAPLGVFARTYPIIDTTAAGGVTIGNATLAQGVTIDSGAGAINIGNSATGKTITIGSATGTGALNMYAGTGNFILDGAGGTTYSFGTSTTTGTFTMGGTSQTGTANLFTGTAAMTLNIGTGNATTYLGNVNGTTGTTVNSGTGGITLLTATSGNLSLKTGTTGTVTLDSGSTGSVSIGTGASEKTITVGNSTGATAVNINSGTGGITLLTGTTGNLSLTTGTTGTVTLDSGTTGTVNIGTGTGAKGINIGGTGANTVTLANSQTGGSLTIGNSMTTGTISIGGTGAQTGTIAMGTGTGAQAISIGTGAAAKTVTLGSTNGASSLTLDAGTGTIAMGTSASARTINIGTGAAAQTVSLGSTTGASRLNLNAGTGGMYANGLTAQTNGNVTVCINSTTHLMYYGLTSSCNTSSQDTKHNIEGISLGLAAVRALRPVSFEYNGTDQAALGFIAEEVALIDERPVERDATGKIVGLNYDQIVPILAKGVQELDMKVDSQGLALAEEISTLSGQVAGMADKVPEVTSESVGKQIAEAIGNILNSVVNFIGKVIFHSDVAFLGRPTFNKDTAGFATIMAGGSEVEVTFGREYGAEPIVTATAQIVGGAAVADIPGYAVADVNTKGFKIRLSRTTGMNIRFAWVALAVSNSNSFQGSGGAVAGTSVTEPTDTPTPTIEVTPVATDSAIIEPTPEITITPAPIPAVEITPTPIEEITPTPTEVTTPTPTPTEVIII